MISAPTTTPDTNHGVSLLPDCVMLGVCVPIRGFLINTSARAGAKNRWRPAPEADLHLVWFLPYVWARALAALILRRVDVIYFSDGVVGSVATLLAPLRGRVRFVVTIYGLEMAYGNLWARRLMRWGTRQCQRIVVISENTREIAVRWGVERARTELAYVGVEPLELPSDRATEVRERVARGLPIRPVVPEAVAEYIESNKLYLNQGGVS